MQGEHVGGYVITELLAQGGMGAVYLAEHELLHRPAAIKMLLPALSADPEVVGRFFDEARAATAVADPGIVQVFDFGYHKDGRAYLVMEHLDGDTLDVRMEHIGCLPPQDALRIVRQLAISLEAAHARGVIHRDLKLENVLLVKDPMVPGGERAKILDFGVAKLQHKAEPDRTQTRAGAILGTPLYMSPEQCRNAHDIDGRSDIYALGCLLFCMTTGRAPFDFPSSNEIIAAHLREPPPRPSAANLSLDLEWGGVLDGIVLRCLMKNPDDRFQRMSELAAEIGDLLEDPSGAYLLPRAPPPVRTPTPVRTPVTALGQTLLPSQLTPPPRRLRWALAAVALAAGLGAAGWMVLDSTEVPPIAAAEPATPVVVEAPVIVAPPVIAPPPAVAPPTPAAAPVKKHPARLATKRGSHVRTAPRREDRPDTVDRSD